MPNEFSPRPAYKGHAPKFTPGSAPRPTLTEEVSALDDELIRLLAKRSKLVIKMRGGKTHAASPASIKSEKQIRNNWEAKTGRISRDSRFIRQLFNLIQDIAVQNADLPDDAPALALYNLAPIRSPVRLNLAGPGLEEEAMLWIALGAAFDVEMQIEGVQRTKGMLDFSKAFSQAGANINWVETSDFWSDSVNLQHAGRNCTFGADSKAVFVGESHLAFYLLTLLNLNRPGKKRFTAAHALKNTDLSALYKMLPELGGRLAFSVPGSRGLPASVEHSGVLPSSYTIPADLPLEGIMALLLSAFVWQQELTLNLENLPAAAAYKALSSMTGFFTAFPEAAEVNAATVQYKPWAGLPNKKTVPVVMNPVLAAFTLSLPFFTGGETMLHGNWAELPESAACIALLRRAGLKVELKPGCISSTHQGYRTNKKPPEAILCNTLPENLLPLFWVFNAALAAFSVQPKQQPEPQSEAQAKDQPKTQTDLRHGLFLSHVPEDADLFLAGDLLTQFGLSLQQLETGFNISPLPPDEARAIASKNHGWSSMNPYWTLAFSLGAFFKSNLKLSNPDSATDIFPGYWALYNGLPDPSQKVTPSAKNAPAHRRIVTEAVVEPPKDLSRETD
jgi:chorismate mutase